MSADIFGIYDVPYEKGSETGSGRVCEKFSERAQVWYIVLL